MVARRLPIAACIVFVLSFRIGALQAAPLPDVAFTDLSGKPQSLEAFKGKVVVLNFWATWCGPCRDELPMLDKLVKEYGDKDVVILAASIDDESTQPKIQSFLEKKRIENMTIWKGARAEALKQFNLGIAVPATVILDRDGTVIGRVLGEAEKRDITFRVNWVLSGKPGKHPKMVQNNL